LTGVDFSTFGIVLEEAFLEGVFPDLMEDAELLGAVCALRVDIGGAGPSTSQLHYHLLAITQSSTSWHLTLKNSPRVLLYGCTS
jgi:hypothetical protein